MGYTCFSTQPRWKQFYSELGVQRNKILTAIGIDVTGTVVLFCDTVKLLGVTLDSALTMDRHVTKVIRSCN